MQIALSVHSVERLQSPKFLLVTIMNNHRPSIFCLMQTRKKSSGNAARPQKDGRFHAISPQTRSVASSSF